MQRPMDWLAFMEEKRNELANTGHIMDDDTFITHLINSPPQKEYKGVILVIKERLRVGTCDLAQVEQLLEDKYLSMKFVKGWEKKRTTMPCLLALPKRKGRKNTSKADVVTVERLDIRQRIVLTRRTRKKRTLKTNPTNKRHSNLKRMAKERAKEICQKLNAIIVEKWVILPRNARNLAKTPILLEKVSKFATSEN